MARLVGGTLDLSRQPSPHSWGGPMLSAPGGRRVRQTWMQSLEGEIAREADVKTAPVLAGYAAP